MSNDEIEVLDLCLYHTNGKPMLLAGLNPDRRRRQRRPTLANALRQADRAGIVVAGVTLKSDGSIALAFGKATSENSEVETNEWDTVQ
jgi:hypothetical protein